MDSDRAPDYKPLYPGSVVFNNKLSHRVVGDGDGGAIGIVKTRYEAKLNEDGKLIDAEGYEFIALPVGVYSVTFSFGQYSWPNFDIEVEPEHTIDSPLWLPSKSPVPAGPGVVHVVSEEARLAAEAAAASAEFAAERAENALLGVIDYDLVMERVEPLVDDAVSVGLAGVDDLVASALVPYATTTALTSGLAGKQDTGDYALVSQLPDVSGLATKSELASGLADKQDTGDYATTSALTSGLAGKQDSGDYALVSQLPDVSGLATTTALTSGLAGKQDSGDYVTASDLGGYATTEYVDQVVGDINTALAGILGGN